VAASLPIAARTALNKKNMQKLLQGVNWTKLRDDIVIPLKEDISQGAEALKDSVNSYMYRSTYPSDRSIEEAITNHFIKFGK